MLENGNQLKVEITESSINIIELPSKNSIKLSIEDLKTFTSVILDARLKVEGIR